MCLDLPPSCAATPRPRRRDAPRWRFGPAVARRSHGWQAHAVRLLSPELLPAAASERRLSAQRAAAATAYAVATTPRS